MVNINAYKVVDGKVRFDNPVEIEVIHVGDMFCALKIGEMEIVTRPQDLIAALDAAVKQQ
jgi:hypothetical protein